MLVALGRGSVCLLERFSCWEGIGVGVSHCCVCAKSVVDVRSCNCGWGRGVWAVVGGVNCLDGGLV